MLKLMEGCTCPQKSVYIVAGLSNLVLSFGVLLNLHNTKSKDRNNYIKKILLNIVLIVLLFVIIDYLCDKDYNILAWILAILPFVSSFILGYGISYIFVKENLKDKYGKKSFY